MRTLLVVVLHPRIEIGLHLLQRPIDLLAECATIEFVQHGLVEALADPIGLRMPGHCARVILALSGSLYRTVRLSSYSDLRFDVDNVCSALLTAGISSNVEASIK